MLLFIILKNVLILAGIPNNRAKLAVKDSLLKREVTNGK